MENQPKIKSSFICEFCEEEFLKLIKHECIEGNLMICKSCSNYLQNEEKKLYNKLAQWENNDLIYQNIKAFFRIIVTSEKYYMLKYLKCEICFQFMICSKICTNEHYFCLPCTKYFIQCSMPQKQIKCPMINCNQEIDHYLIACFIQKIQFNSWFALKYNLFCPNSNCRNTIKILPYKKLTSQIMKINEGYSQCSNCQQQICNCCWTLFKSSYKNHAKICNTENFRNQLLKQFLVENEVQQCPKCKFYSLEACRKEENQIQQCQICQFKFCMLCSSGDLHLFSAKKPFNYTCFHCHKRMQRKVICIKVAVIFAWTFMFLSIPLIGFFWIGDQLTQSIQKAFKGKSQCSSCFCCICFPCLIVFFIIGSFFKLGYFLVCCSVESLKSYVQKNFRILENLE